MQVPLDSSSRKRWLLSAALVLALVYLTLAGRQALSSFFAGRVELSSLRVATRLDSTNADYFDRLGRGYMLVARDPGAAAAAYREAVHLNPHSARYWFDLANAYEILGDERARAGALEHAVQADPTTPDVAWEAGNLYLVQGQTDKALREFRVVLASASYQGDAAMQLCWRIDPDVDALLQNVVPNRAGAYVSFLYVLMQKQQSAGAAKVWSALMAAHESFELRILFDYIRYLVAGQDVEQARLAWQQAAALLGLDSYLPSRSNLIVNGDFSLNVLNGGFDWQYRKQDAVTLALDPSDFHGGHRSLSITFHGPGVSDAGILQIIPVRPQTTYDFTGYYKTSDLEGAGGPHFTIQDVYSENILFESAELRDASFWKSVNGEFTTGPDTKLVFLHVQRLPADNAIRGKLWIDDFHLVPKQP